MDLSSLETAAGISKHAVGLLAAGGVVAGYRAWRFAVKKNESKRLHAQFAVVVLAALGAFAGYSVYYFTDEISLLRQKLAEEKEQELERFKIEKGAEIESASARAAEANERALKLERDNLPLRKQVATLENANLALRGEVATLEKGATAAEIKLAEVRKQQEPRVVREDIILPILGTAPPGSIKMGYLQGIPEVALFTTHLSIALRKANWVVLDIKPVPSVLGKGYSYSELFLMMRDLDHMDPPEQALVKALRSAGYKLQVTRDETLTANNLLLLIGPKL